ncbi:MULTISPECIES: FKBP-type peptidyl-prolyl cis-trans isomerase [unclassified Vibrio]|uniref:FKBP-type peptidyl-prolyl cis-trans isomerase n=3 Tax=Vibrio TaxID=662 RepID=UPI000B8EE8BE|nr:MULTISPECIES: FKBP-type peptidyl-prolyl cis-trans isomerase [unclassified Vibrio]OXX30081.1 peptidylprolyl isomerase [Vibrio sp. V14_P6S14T42]OXX32339.1 peptidylprolyl isomerase [Vibrio sp. V04_P4A5T148]OXX51070.1 peptidylprolyl isomerase [Vibrio sp. V18_P1S4T112]
MSKFVFPIIIFLLAGFFIYRTWNNHKIADENFAKGQAFLAENAQQDGVITTESGLQYLVLQQGTGTVHPKANSRVKVHYHGTLLDGSVFDSSVERNDPIVFGLKQVIQGWQEGLQLMVEGQKMRLFIPSNLGYGKSGSGPIPPASVLIFDVELIEIQ